MSDLLRGGGALAILLSLAAILLAAYALRKAFRERRQHTGSLLRRVDLLVLAAWALVSSLLPWYSDDFLPFLPKVSMGIGFVYLVVSGFVLRDGIGSLPARRKG
jgi:hypothetical protein